MILFPRVVAHAGEEDDIAAAMAADRAAEEAAAAAVEDAAEEADDDDDADAHDADADSARFDPQNPDVFPLTDMPPEAKDVEFGFAFSSGLENKKTLTLGQKARTLIACANGGRVRHHVWGVMGSLNSAKNFDLYVQNFTYGVVNKTVGAGGELSFEYTFEPNERLDTTDFVLALSVFYEAQSTAGNVIRAHSTTFFNQTVTAVAGPQTVNNATFMVLLVLFIVAAAGAGYYAKSLGEDSKRNGAEMGTTSESGKEWLQEHQNMLQGGGRTKSKSS